MNLMNIEELESKLFLFNSKFLKISSDFLTVKTKLKKHREEKSKLTRIIMKFLHKLSLFDVPNEIDNVLYPKKRKLNERYLNYMLKQIFNAKEKYTNIIFNLKAQMINIKKTHDLINQKFQEEYMIIRMENEQLMNHIKSLTEINQSKNNSKRKFNEQIENLLDEVNFPIKALKEQINKDNYNENQECNVEEESKMAINTNKAIHDDLKINCNDSATIDMETNYDKSIIGRLKNAFNIFNYV